MIHELKITPKHFQDVLIGRKTFEIRKNDRDFHAGDLLALNEFNEGRYTGNSCLVYIDFIFSCPEYLQKDYIILSIKPCSVKHDIAPYELYSVPLATMAYDEKEREEQ